jgi:hypothetical protein
MNAVEWLAGHPPQDVTFLCGAGISLDAPTSLPTVNRFLNELLQACDAPADLAAQVFARASLPLEDPTRRRIAAAEKWVFTPAGN